MNAVPSPGEPSAKAVTRNGQVLVTVLISLLPQIGVPYIAGHNPARYEAKVEGEETIVCTGLMWPFTDAITDCWLLAYGKGYDEAMNQVASGTDQILREWKNNSSGSDDSYLAQICVADRVPSPCCLCGQVDLNLQLTADHINLTHSYWTATVQGDHLTLAPRISHDS